MYRSMGEWVFRRRRPRREANNGFFLSGLEKSGQREKMREFEGSREAKEKGLIFFRRKEEKHG